MTDAVCAQRGLIPVEADVDSAEWWAAVAAGRFTLPRCRSCGAYSFPPLPLCPRCGTDGMQLVDASGHGTIYSWVTIHRALDQAFTEDVPYTVLAVDLEEGPRIFGRLCGGSTVQAGAPVRARIYEVKGQRLVGFAPASPEGG